LESTHGRYIPAYKAHADFNNGLSVPSRKQISHETGLSERQIQRALNILEDEGLLIKTKRWKHNVYRLKEKLEDDQTVITRDHLPAALKKARQELHNFLLTGDSKDAKIIHVEHLTINIVQGDQTILNTKVELDKISDPQLREQMKNILERISRDR
jgi:DNA-binding transcriptional regulator YhcF (GntR family)